MNLKVAKLARKVNRKVGTLGKRDNVSLPHKLPRSIKKHWASLSHKARGKLTRTWSSAVYERHG